MRSGSSGGLLTVGLLLALAVIIAVFALPVFLDPAMDAISKVEGLMEGADKAR